MILSDTDTDTICGSRNFALIMYEGEISKH